MKISPFQRTQQAMEILFAQYDVLLGDYHRHEACTILAARHQVERHKIVTLINDRDSGFVGGSGETLLCVASTPSAIAGTA